MEIYRISCYVMFAMMLLSGVLLLAFPRLRHKENFYMQMLNNLNVGFFSGLMVSFSVALVSYFYAEQVFLQNLFQQSRYIYQNLELIESELSKEPSTNLKNIESPSLAIAADAKKVNFLSYSPFLITSEVAKQVKTLSALYQKFEKYPTFATRMQFLQNEKQRAEANLDTRATELASAEIATFLTDLKREVKTDLTTLHRFVFLLKTENSSRYIPWEDFKDIQIKKSDDNAPEKGDNRGHINPSIKDLGTK